MFLVVLFFQMVIVLLVFSTDISLGNDFSHQMVLGLLVSVVDFGLSDLATCNPQNRECSCADTSSRVLAFVIKAFELKGCPLRLTILF